MKRRVYSFICLLFVNLMNAMIAIPTPNTPKAKRRRRWHQNAEDDKGVGMWRGIPFPADYRSFWGTL